MNNEWSKYPIVSSDGKTDREWALRVKIEEKRSER